MLKKILLSPWTALLTLALVLTVRVIDTHFVESIRLRYFDTLIANKEPSALIDSPITIVNIDEEALNKYGQWPLPRTEYAKIVNELYARNAGLVVLDIMFSEPDRLNGDSALASAMYQHPVVLVNVPSDKTKNIPRKPGTAVINSDFQDRIVKYPGIIANIPVLEQNAVGIGTVNTLSEVDGVTRRMPLITSVDGNLYPSLAMEILRVASGDTTTQIKLNELGVEKMRIPQYGPITTDNLGRVWVDYSQSFNISSLSHLPKDFNGGVVIVGPTAAGISNPVPTSIGAVYPHYLQAHLLNTMMNGVVISRPDYADGAECLAILVLGIVLLLLTRYVYVGLGSVVIIVTGIAYASHYIFSNHLLLFDITFPIGAILLVSLHAYGVKFVSEFLQKQQIKKQFGTYLSPAMVEKLQKNPELLALGGESRELSIMFTDVRGFTTISEHYGKDVQGLTKIMNRYMTTMTAKILENNGTLDKYIGDAQMAFWNAPLDDSDHAKNALRTGLAMLKDLEKFNEEISKEGVPAFGMGLGINTDTVVVGNMGSTQRFDYTCLGDGVNLASRLEGQSKPYGVKIILGPRTAELVSDEFTVIELDLIAVKGKTEPVKIYTVAPFDDSLALDKHKKFLLSYHKGDWKTAKFYINGMKNDGLLAKGWNGELHKYYELMLERMETDVPDNWDGVYRATSK